MQPRKKHCCCVGWAVAVLLPSLSAQQVESDRRFTTGPPAVDRSPPSGTRFAPHQPAPLSVAGLPDGSDIRVNQRTSSAQNETSIAVNPNDPDNWVGVANDYINGSVETGWYSTFDSGQTWTTGTFGIDASFSFSGDPSVCFDTNGKVHVICVMYWGAGGSKVTHFRSADGGRTWSSGTNIDLQDGNDKPQVEADHSNSASRDSVTVAFNRFSTPSGDHVYASTAADGVNWSAAQRLNGAQSTITMSPDVTQGPGGEIYVMWADRATDRIWVDRSIDGGVTYAADVLVGPYSAVPSPIPGSSFRMFDIFAITADATGGPFSGNVYIAYHTWNGSHADVRCRVSTDGGQTWPVDNVVHPADLNNADQVFPGLCVDPKGNLNIVYLDRRLDPSNLLLWTWVSRSSDGGASFREYRASDVGWNHFSDITFGGQFIGDYIDVDSSERTVHPFWVDGRSNDQDVYADVMNLDLFSDVDTISAGTGGSANLPINIGPNFAGATYWVLASCSGTQPGFTLPSGLNLPLNLDACTNFSIQFPNSSIFPSSFGTLDSSGSALAGLSTVGPRPNLAGLVMSLSVVVFQPQAVYATHPTQITFTN